MLQAMVDDMQHLIQRTEVLQRLYLLNGGSSLEINRISLEVGTLHEQLQEMNIDDTDITGEYVNQYLMTGKLPLGDFDIQ